MITVGEWIVEALEAYGVDTVFGIPGVHTVELYRGLAKSGISHVTPRHEQGAGFMADGYYRATGRVAAAFVITGPGVTNILTPMAQAYADSIPMLVLSSVNRRSGLGMGGGDLHEIRNQGLIAGQAAAFSHTLADPAQLPELLRRAWAVFEGARPRPVHVEIPLDMLSEPAPEVSPRGSEGFERQGSDLSAAANVLREAKAPLILAGGGTIGAPLQELAELLDAPTVMTINARGTLAPDHPLGVPASPSLNAVRSAVRDADVVLAVGTEMGRTDYDMYDLGGFDVPGKLIRIDIEAEQLGRNASFDIALLGDANDLIAELVHLLATDPPDADDGEARAAHVREEAWEEIGPKYRNAVGLLNTIRNTLPGTPIVGDSTQAIYAGNLYFAASAPRTWFNASTGYGALGYGLPAAIGAAKSTKAPVVCLAGDGGLQFSLAELGTAVEEKLPLIVLVWDNKGYGEIKHYMVNRQITPVGVDLHTPDFVGLARAYGCEATQLEDLADLPDLLREASDRQVPTLIVFDEAVVLGRT
jgi:acetolactate synthase-1/2/3 large subunit